jgi:hypothetical protein
MAVLINEPANFNPQTEDWQNIILKSTKLGGGYIFVFFSEMDTPNEPQVLAGSRFELNGSFYEVLEDETIQGEPENKQVNYVYGVPSDTGATCIFKYSDQEPSFNVRKGGWFYGKNRALLVFWFDNAEGKGFMDKKLVGALQLYDRVMILPEGDYIPDDAQGKLMWTATTDAYTEHIELKTGLYRFEVSGGSTSIRAGGFLSAIYKVERNMIVKSWQGQSVKKTTAHYCEGGGGGSVIQILDMDGETKRLFIAGGGGGDKGRPSWMVTSGGSGGGSGGGWGAGGSGGEIEHYSGGRCGDYNGGSGVGTVSGGQGQPNGNAGYVYNGSSGGGGSNNGGFGRHDSAGSGGAGVDLDTAYRLLVSRVARYGGAGAQWDNQAVAGAGGNSENSTLGGGTPAGQVAIKNKIYRIF